ncbi:hypothetical protein A2U01_0060158, partial [Trifolium medium]|nr:hypothetical protein [Trifolium medium]
MLKEGVTKRGETPNPAAVATNLFEDKQVPDLTFLEKYLSPNPLDEQTFTHENRPSSEPQPEQPKQPEQPQPKQPEQPQPKQPEQPQQPEHQQQPEQQPQPEQDQPQSEPKR